MATGNDTPDPNGTPPKPKVKKAADTRPAPAKFAPKGKKK